MAADILEMSRAHLRGKHVEFGLERMEDLVRRNEAGLVWVTSDLAKQRTRKIALLCIRNDVPCLTASTSGVVSEVIFRPNVRILTLRKSFPGLREILHACQDQFYTE